MTTSTDPGRFPAEQTAFPGPYQTSTTLPLGDWHLMANGRIYTLTIHAVSGSEVKAELSSGEIVKGEWDAATGTLSFNRVLPHVTQKFTGYLLQYDQKAEFKWRMAGTFGDVTPESPLAGWYATLPRP